MMGGIGKPTLQKALMPTDLGLGLGSLKSSPGVHPKPPFGPILDSTGADPKGLYKLLRSSLYTPLLTPTFLRAGGS